MKIYVISFLFSFCLCIMGCKANQTSSNSDKTSSSQIAALVNEMDSLKAQIKMANKNDIIVLAGKGHEPYQEINGEKNPFDERIIVKDIINKM